MELNFQEFPKIHRLSREIVITEKIDGTNAQIIIGEDGEFATASRTKIIIPGDDNFGFARWAYEHKEQLLKLGPGRHFGEWWGSGIQRGYGLPKGEKRFSLFNTHRWADPISRPECCDVVPMLWIGIFDTRIILSVLESLANLGSKVAPGFMDPEGIVIYHTQGNVLFKKTIKGDDKGKNFGA